MTLTVKHASLTGAAANPDVLVDGPKWDADHTVTGDLPVSQLDGGTGANSDTYWRGDGSWAVPPAGFSNGTSTVTGQARTAVAADVSKLIKRSNAGGTSGGISTNNMQDTLPGSGAGILPLGLYTYRNVDASGFLAIVVASGATLDGSSTKYVLLGPDQTVQFYSDGSNYTTVYAPVRAKCASSVALQLFADIGSGSDTKPGVLAGSSAVATIQAMADTAYQRCDVGEGQIIGNLAAGTYVGFYLRGRLVGVGNPLQTNPAYHSLLLKGSGKSTCTISFSSGHGITLVQSTIHLDAIKITGSGGGDGISIGTGSVVGLGDIDYGAITGGGSHVKCNASYFHYDNDETISGAAASHFNLINCSTAENSGASAGTTSNTPAFPNGFVSVDNTSSLNVGAQTYGGTGSTGPRWVNSGGTISANSRALDAVFPGSSNGTATLTSGPLAGDSQLTINGNTVANASLPSGSNIFHTIGADASQINWVIDSFGSNPGVLFARAASGTAAAKTAMTADSIVFAFGTAPYDGSSYASTAPAAIWFKTINAQSGSDHSSYITFRTTPAGSTTPAESFRAQGSGGLSVGTTTDGGAGSILANASIKSKGTTSGIGYATGAGGAITQITSRTTGVTLNTVAGAITLVSAAGSAIPSTMTVTNSAVAATDTIIVNQKSGADLYNTHITNVAAGSFNLSFWTTGGATVEQPVFNFAVIKAVAS